jgi:putative ABC transport system permease protein
MKTILRNFLSVFRRFKMATVLNVLGLSVAFAAFIVIMMQVRFERSFDKCHPTSERVFRPTLNEPGVFSVILPRGFIESIIRSSPHIEAGTLTMIPYPFYYTYTVRGEKQGVHGLTQVCHPDLVKVFDFPILMGDANCLNEPQKAIIPESLARKLFGDEPAIGKTLHAEEDLWAKSETDLSIGAVYRDFPENTQLKNCIYTAIDGDYQLNNFQSSNYLCYLLLDDPSSAKEVADNFNATFDFSELSNNDPEEQIRLTPLTDIYYLNEGIDAQIVNSGNKDVTNLLFLIAFLIIIIAVINYVNFSMALTPMRIKSINTQKVLGSPDSTLRRSLIIEAAAISVASWLLSLFIVWGLNDAAALPFISADLRLEANMPILILSGSMALIIGIMAGVYPAFYMVSFPPALVLKGRFGLSPSGRKLRTALIGFQFIVSIMLIIGAGLIQLQNDYMRGYSLGFDKDQIAIVRLSENIYENSHETYVNRLKQFPGITDVAFSMEKISSQESYNTCTSKYKDKQFSNFMMPVSYNFFRVMGIPIEEGRDFTPADEQSEDPVYILNRIARQNIGLETGDILNNWLPGRIAGFTGDVKVTSLRQGEEYVAFFVGAGDIFPSKTVSYIRLAEGTDIHAAVEHIRKSITEIDPAYPFDIEFYDTIFEQLYHKENALRSLATLFGLLAIILSLVGVFGLVVFETQYRRKEIAIRKVHGSTIREILEMLNKQYIYIVCICFVIASPIAYFLIKKWMESFAYKTPVYWWVYAIALLIVLIVTTATVTFQSWRAANANPVDSLKAE